MRRSTSPRGSAASVLTRSLRLCTAVWLSSLALLLTGVPVTRAGEADATDLAACQPQESLPTKTPSQPGAQPDSQPAPKAKTKPAQLVVAGGCFWCTEAVYEELDGVLSVISGYAGGTPETANYRAVSTGATKHAEAIEIVYDPAKITHEQLLEVFFDAHDPTQLNRQGPDVGTQYRSAIFYATPAEKQTAQQVIDRLTADKKFRKPIVTTLEPLEKFFPAEEYHQDYAARNPFVPYVRQSSTPKVIKVRKKYADWLKAKDKEKAKSPAK